MKFLKKAALCAALGATVLTAGAQTTLRFVPHAPLGTFDPILTTAYVVRNHAYMIYDTLFAMDEKGAIKLQMLEKYDLSADKKTWTFTLRAGQTFHDGAPVTSDDVIQSLKRWGSRDGMGMKLLSFVDRWDVVDANTFRMVLKEPYGLVIDSLGKPSSNVPFVMPKRFAETPGDKALGPESQIGSGPFMFKRDEFRAGEKAVYTKFAAYKPRSEPANGLSGGKVAKVDRVEWIFLKDPQTQYNALIKGEVDMIEQLAFEQVDAIQKEKDVEIHDLNPVRYQYMMRFNHLVPPFNDPKIRRAAMLAVNQESFLRTQVGSGTVGGKTLYSPCVSMYPCGSTYYSDKSSYFTAAYNEQKMQQARALLKEAKYDGTPILVMRPTDLNAISKLPLVATQLLRQAGFTVNMESMDWNSVIARRAKKDPVSQGGWNIFLTAWAGTDLLNPVANPAMQGLGTKSGWFGWAEDAQLEALRDGFARESDDAKRKQIAEQAQLRAYEVGTHAPLGEYTFMTAVRKGVKGMVKSPATALWNITK